jgi:hypothetical protein
VKTGFSTVLCRFDATILVCLLGRIDLLFFGFDTLDLTFEVAV